MSEKGHNKEGSEYYRKTRQGIHHWKREKTLKSLYILRSILGDSYSLDYLDSHFESLVKLVESRKKYNEYFKNKVYFNKQDNQIYIFSFISEDDGKMVIQTSTYGKYRGRDDESGLFTMTLDKALLLLRSEVLIPMDISVSTIKSKWSKLTREYYAKREAFEIKTHNELIDKLFKEFVSDSAVFDNI